MKLHFYSLALLSLMLFALNQEVQSKSYSIPVIRVEVAVQPDGTVRITEYRTYEFDGSYSWADYQLPFQGFTAIKDIRLSEGETSFINENSEEPGTFLVQRNDEQIQVKWFYEAEDEQRTFSVSYILEGAIVIGPEWCELFWNYVSSNREKDTDSLSIQLQLPQTVTPDSLYSWKRGPQERISLTDTSNGYTVTASNIDDDEFVKIRSIFPRSVFDSDAITTSNEDFTLAWAQADEEQFRKEQAVIKAKNERYAGYGQQLIILVCLFSIAAFVFFYQKYGKRHSARSVSATETIMIPGRLKPAVAGWLLQGKSIHSGHLMATLLDLARRNYFVIKEQPPEKQWFGGEKKRFNIEKAEFKPSDDLTKWEASLAEFVSDEIDDSNNQIDELFSGSTIEASKWFSSWKKGLKKDCEAKGWYDQESYKGVYTNIGVQIILLIPAILATIWAGPIGIIAILTTTIFLIASAGIIRRTQEGEIAYRRWKAYKEGLLNAGDHSVDQDLLDKHFIYATAFGLSKGSIETIFKQCDRDDIIFAWFVFHSSAKTSPADIASTFTTLGATGTSSFPGAASASSGAGASAGAAGGGAAGGAG